MHEGGERETERQRQRHGHSEVERALTCICIPILCTQGLPDQIGAAVAASISSAYQESIRSTLLPGFERSCSEMMKQVDENFRRGTQDCKLTIETKTRLHSISILA